jgi:sarcosine oxidase gamma subunit
MSVANFGFETRTQFVSNLNGVITTAIVGPGAVAVSTTLIQDAGGAEIPLVLGPGKWTINGRAEASPVVAASDIIYCQVFIFDLADLGTPVAVSGPIVGAKLANGTNVNFYFSINGLEVVPAGTTRSLVLRAFTTGNTGAITYDNNFSRLTATKVAD